MRVRVVLALAGTLAVLGSSLAHARLIPTAVPEVPVLVTELRRGTGSATALTPFTPSPKVVDGDVSDWAGTPTGFGGTAVYSAGEFVYQDHLFDAYGADDGGDAQRMPVWELAQGAEPRTYRLEALVGQDLPSQAGVEGPDLVTGQEHYGNAGMIGVADIVEARIATGGDGVAVLVRTTTMTASDETAVLVLADTRQGGGGAVPFGSGLVSDRADVAILLAGHQGWRADLRTGETTMLPAGSVASNPSGWTNAVEAVLDDAALGLHDQRVGLAVATGRHDGQGALATLSADGAPLATNVANVAFRFAEPVRTWFDRGQAMDLYTRTVDPYFVDVALADLQQGRTERFVPGPGYHDRVFRSSDTISVEQGLDGVWQHYGLYLPDGWTPEGSDAFPLQWWFHWRGGNAHSAAMAIPRMFRTLGDGEAPSALSTGIPDSVVVSPRGRGTSTWYVGLGHADFLEVWDDVFALMGDRLDDRRVYASGHSMGGWASYLMPILYPDRFAGTVPYAGPVTQGAWTGLDIAGCDDLKWDDYTPCYIEANGSRPRDQHTRRLLENLRHVPVSVMQGAIDELVPVSGVTRQVERLVELQYRHRYYLYPAYEHYSHPIADEWADAGRYVHRFAIPDHPGRVTYIRDTKFEEATEQVQSKGFAFDFSFDSAYWMRGLEVAAGAEQAVFDGRSLAVQDPDVIVTPEAGGPAPGQHGPFVMTGLAWTSDPLGSPPDPSNGFELTLTGASGVELDLAGMKIDPGEVIAGALGTDHGLRLRLDGGFAAVPPVSCDCAAAVVGVDGGVLVIDVPPGVAHLTIG